MTPSLGRLAAVMLRIGNLTFGGGAAAVAALQREMVSRLRWLNESQFSLSYALSRVTPGTNQLAFCTAAGWLLRRWPGALIALLAASIPSCLIVWGVTVGFDVVNRYSMVRIAISGAMAASVGILLAAFWLIVGPQITRKSWVRSLVIVAVTIGLSLFAEVTPVLVLAIAAAAGFFWDEPS